MFCENLTHIHIPESVKRIKESAFSGCEKLQSIVLPEGLTEIEANAFFICYKLADITLPKSLRKIGDYAFYECRSIRNVFYSGSQKDKENMIIGSDFSSFQTATWHFEVNEDNTIRLPSGITIVEESVFDNTSASIYIIPEGVNTIMAGSFSNLTKAAKIYLPSSLTEIDNSAFFGAENALFIFPSSSCPAYQLVKDLGLKVTTE